MTTFTKHMNLEKPSDGASNAGQSINDNSDKDEAGRTWNRPAGEAISKCQWVRFSGGEAVLADATTEANAIVMGVATEDYLEDAEGYYLYCGQIYKAGWGLTPNTRYYLGNTPGSMVTAPPGGGSKVVELGVSDDTGEWFFIAIRVFLTGSTAHGSLTGLNADDHTQYLLVSGARGLSGNWDAGSFEVRAQTFQSDVATGTAPLIVASETVVTHLNADFLDGNHAAAFAAASHGHDGGTP